MGVPPDTGFDSLLAAIWFVVAIVVLGVSLKIDLASSERRRILSSIGIGTVAILGLGSLLFSLERWGFLGKVLGANRIYLRGLPTIGTEILGLLVAFHVLNTSIRVRS